MNWRAYLPKRWNPDPLPPTKTCRILTVKRGSLVTVYHECRGDDIERAKDQSGVRAYSLTSHEY